jgi:molecular chaperone IbpA
MKSLVQFHPGAFIGFDTIAEQLEEIAKHATDHYPPHDIIKVSDSEYSIELAVAGFTYSELTITEEDRNLIVIGTHRSKQRDVVYRGISTKNFKKMYRLSEHVEVNGANLQDGILSISLKVIVRQEMRPRKIDINRNEETTNAKSINTTTKRHL